MFKKLIKEIAQSHCSHQWNHIETKTMIKDIETYEQVAVEKVCCSKCELLDYITPQEWSRIQEVQDVPRLRSARHDKVKVGGATV